MSPLLLAMHRVKKDWHTTGVTQSLPSHNCFLGEISLWLGDRTTPFLPTESQARGLVLDLWIKVDFTLLQPWLYHLFAFLAALLAEVQVPAVLTQR